MKKLLIIPMFVIAFAATATYASAQFSDTRSDNFSNSVFNSKVFLENENHAHTVNTILTNSNSGENDPIDGVSTATITSGSATANGSSDTSANGSIISATQPTVGQTFLRNANFAEITNDIQTFANSGRNNIGSTMGDASITSGNASATSSAVTIVNSNTITVGK